MRKTQNGRIILNSYSQTHTPTNLCKIEKVVMQLEENGDNLDAPREIDHWIYFDNEQSRAQYVEKVIRKGYKSGF